MKRLFESKFDKTIIIKKLMKRRLPRERDKPLCRLPRETKREKTMGDEAERRKEMKRGENMGDEERKIASS